MRKEKENENKNESENKNKNFPRLKKIRPWIQSCCLIGTFLLSLHLIADWNELKSKEREKEREKEVPSSSGVFLSLDSSSSLRSFDSWLERKNNELKEILK